jgi:catechol 2,3-dioxygenase-like lactoylglutathione lyase family enzyme
MAMLLQLDHIVIAVHDLDSAVRDYRDLGFTVVQGGVHANRATHNALITFAGGTYLELLASTGEPPLPGVVDFSVLLQHGEGLVGFALRSEDLDTDAVRLRANGFAVGEVTPGERRRADGTVIRWKLAFLDAGFAPFLIQDVTPREWRISNDPAITTHPNRAVGLRAVEIAVREMSLAWERYGRLFGVPPRSEEVVQARCVALHDISREAESSEGLVAVQFVGEQTGDHRFPLDRTHGVRFEPVPGTPP